jgi:hypothetical protein
MADYVVLTPLGVQSDLLGCPIRRIHCPPILTTVGADFRVGSGSARKSVTSRLASHLGRSPSTISREDQIDYMAERERSAERHLLEDVQRRPERHPELMKQIEQVVLGECQEAHLRARRGDAPYGPAMMIDVQDRLRKIARDETALVGDHSYECLIGMAGLLTRECVVWWSPRFPIEGDPT